MTMTADPELSPAAVAVCKMIDSCLSGVDPNDALDALMNAVVGVLLETHEDPDSAVLTARFLADQLPDVVAEQYIRVPQPTDVVVSM